MAIHAVDDDCYGCRLRRKSFNVSAKALPSRQNTVPPRAADPTWEKGLVGENRPDGSFMPYLKPDGTNLRVKEYGEKRRDVDAQVKRLKSDPTVFSKERGNP